MQRSTKQRRAIGEILRSSARPLSPKEIVQVALEQEAAPGPTTVCHSLKIMVEQGGGLARVEVPGQPARHGVAALSTTITFTARSATVCSTFPAAFPRCIPWHLRGSLPRPMS